MVKRGLLKIYNLHISNQLGIIEQMIRNQKVAKFVSI